MFTRFIMASAVSVTLAFSSAAFAASTNFIDNNTYTTDTISGLDWLDVTATQGKSYDDVSGQFGVGGNFKGYRYATGTDFNALITNYTGVAIGTTDYNRQFFFNEELKTLTALLGCTSRSTCYAQINGRIADQPPGPLTTEGYVATIILFAGGDYVQTTAHRTTLERDYDGSTSGSFLVRDTLITTPIPAAAFMFAPALLGFIGLRRRAKNAVA
jgi:hypothetical protein